MHPPPIAGVIGSGGSDHQRVAGGSVEVENPENGENRCENDENKHMKTAKIRPKSLRFLQILPNLGHFRQDLGQIRQNLTEILTKMVQISPDLPNIIGNLVGRSDRFDRILEKENRPSTCQTWVLEEQTRCRPEKSDQSTVGWVRLVAAVGSSWSGLQTALGKTFPHERKISFC